MKSTVITVNHINNYVSEWSSFSCIKSDPPLGGVRNYQKLKSFRNYYRVCLTHPPTPLDRNKKFMIYQLFSICNRSASGIVPFESGATVFCRSTAFQNALDHDNQTITTEVTLFLVITTIRTRFVISVFFSSVIDHNPPTQIRTYYGMILTFDNYEHPLRGAKGVS